MYIISKNSSDMSIYTFGNAYVKYFSRARLLQNCKYGIVYITGYILNKQAISNV